MSGSRFRYWWTGGLSLLLAAASQTGVRRIGQSCLAHSRFNIDETVGRLERAAKRNGLHVPARIMLRPQRSTCTAAAPRQVLVALGLESHTSPVAQEFDGGALMMLLALQVSGDSDGREAWVEFCDPDSIDLRQLELPPDVHARIAALPALVEQALA